MKRWTEEQFIEAVKTSHTKLEVLKRLNLKFPGGFNTINKWIKKLNLDISHFTPHSRTPNTNRKLVPATHEDIFCVDSLFDPSYVRRRIFKDKLVEHKCGICGLTDWQSKPIVLHLDHINGIKTDNRLENLRFICPNCHSQTPTYCGRNIKKNWNKQDESDKTELSYRSSDFKSSQNKHCYSCGAQIDRKAKTCVPCWHKASLKICWPSNDELLDLINKFSYSELGRQLGVSDNAIRKYLQRQGIEPPKRRKSTKLSAA